MAKLYRVIGLSHVHGFAPGETFHADLDEKHEQRMFAGGFLELASPATRGQTPRFVPEVAASESTEDEEE